MEFAIRRLIERTIIARRGNAPWIRSSLNNERHDLAGVVSEVKAGGVLVDKRQRWPDVDLYGRFELDGNSRAGETVSIASGAAQGSEWEALTVQGSEIALVDAQGDPVDLVAAGLAAGDAYQIRLAQYERAVEWWGKTAVRVIIGHAQDPAVFPCYTVTLGSSSEISRPVGNIGRTIGGGIGAAGPVKVDRVSNWQESISIECLAASPDETLWMYRALEYAYRGWIMYLERVFRERVAAQGSEVRVDPSMVPHGIFVRSFTIGGVLEKIVQEEIPWLSDSQHPVKATAVAGATTPRRVLKS